MFLSSIVTGVLMAAPKLKLIVEKVVRLEGEAQALLQRKDAGLTTTTRFGRVVRGKYFTNNNFTTSSSIIKDAGKISSSKHYLSIEFKDMKWVVSNCDLDTLNSNGSTFLNEIQINQGNKDVELKNGDIIKFGGQQFTSIKVCIDDDVEFGGLVETVDDVKEVKRKRGRPKKQVLDSSLVTENKDASVQVENVMEVKRKPGRPKKQVLESSLLTKTNAAFGQVENVNEGDLESGVGQSKRYQICGAATKEQQAPESSLTPVNKNQEFCGRGKTDVEKKQEEASVAESQDSGNDQIGLNTASKDEVLENVEVDVSEMQMVANNEVLESSHYSKGESSLSVPVSAPEAPNVQDMLTLAKLQKMTLGERIDYIEVCNKADKIIEEMRNRAEQIKKLMDEQRN